MQPTKSIAMAVLCMVSVWSPSIGKQRDEHLKYNQLGVPPTTLDRYVAERDPAFAWNVESRQSTAEGEFVVVRLTSQTWAPGNVTPVAWKHWISLYVPRHASGSIGLLYIGGGTHDQQLPSGPNVLLATIARETSSVVAELHCVPNQPLEFAGDGKPRYEDDLLAESWSRALDTKDPRWIGQLPMTKSAVAAMDALQELTAGDDSLPKLRKFVVSGASKRGWATWLTAAVDTRVAAIIPIVIDVLNIRPSLNHHLQVYGEWSPALADYERRGFDERINDPQLDPLLELVDPYVYRDRLTLPKCIINATGDEFFLPDSSRFYYDALPGEKHLSYVPNTGHGLSNSNALDTLVAFYQSVLAGGERPALRWKIDDSGTLCVECHGEPQEMLLWHAANPERRDFRIATLGQKFVSETVEANGEGTYHIDLDNLPSRGWVAYFVQAVFDTSASRPLRLTTPVWIRGPGGAMR